MVPGEKGSKLRTCLTQRDTRRYRREGKKIKKEKKKDLSHMSTFWAVRVKEINKMAAAQVSTAISQPKRSSWKLG